MLDHLIESGKYELTQTSRSQPPLSGRHLIPCCLLCFPVLHCKCLPITFPERPSAGEEKEGEEEEEEGTE